MGDGYLSPRHIGGAHYGLTTWEGAMGVPCPPKTNGRMTFNELYCAYINT